MPKIPSITEQQLNRLSPSGLDEQFLTRLTACADGSFLEQADDEIEFEKRLRKHRPKGVSSDFSEGLLEIIGDTPFAVDGKIVLFNRSGARRQAGGGTKRSRVFRMNIAAAAAMALLGSAAALFLPAGNGNEKNVTEKAVEGSAIPSPVSSKYLPASFNRNLSDTRDEGVIWQGDKVPHRVLRFTYTDRFTLENDKGETVEVEQPRDEIVIIPEKID